MRKRILCVDFGYTLNIAGGEVRVMSDMINAFIERGYECSLICSDIGEENLFFPVHPKVKFINLGRSNVTLFKKIKRETLRAMHMLNSEKMNNEIYHDKSIKEKLLLNIKNISPDIIFSYDFQSLASLESLKKKINVPVISMIHTGAKYIFNDNFSDFHRKVYDYPDVIQVLTESDVSIVKKFVNKNNIIYIPNPVNAPESYIKDHSKCNKVIINIGRIIKSSKQQLMLVKAFNLIKDDFPNWKIELWGGFYSKDQELYKMEIEEYCKKNSLQNRVMFMGETHNVYEKIQRADICAFSSKKEGFALGLAEAMALGLPAIGYRSCSGVNSIIQDEFNGFLVDDGIEDFASKLRILMADSNLRKRMGENAYESMKRFRPEKIWDQWEDVITRILKNN